MSELSQGSGFAFDEGLRGECPRCATKAVTFRRLFPGTIEELATVKVMVLFCEYCRQSFTADMSVVYANIGQARVSRIYPPPGIHDVASEFIPDNSGIVDALKEVAMCRSVGAMMAGSMAARRAIQLITRQQGASGSNLDAEIKSLHISDGLKTIAHSIRLIGNEAAHPNPEDWNNVTKEDLEEMFGLAIELVNQLYVVPGRTEALRQRTIERTGKDPGQ